MRIAQMEGIDDCKKWGKRRQGKKSSKQRGMALKETSKHPRLLVENNLYGMSSRVLLYVLKEDSQKSFLLNV